MIGEAPGILRHNHTKGDYRIKGELGWWRNMVAASNDDRSSGALAYKKDSTTMPNVARESATGVRWTLYLDTEFNSGSGFTGHSGITGGTESKPNTLVAVYWRRFQ